jgi:hypothetical protein
MKDLYPVDAVDAALTADVVDLSNVDDELLLKARDIAAAFQTCQDVRRTGTW